MLLLYSYLSRGSDVSHRRPLLAPSPTTLLHHISLFRAPTLTLSLHSSLFTLST